jgi:hypothetical protein
MDHDASSSAKAATRIQKRHKPADFRPRACEINPAITYSRAIRTTIGPGCLTAVFGMGTGVASQVWSPESLQRAAISFQQSA